MIFNLTTPAVSKLPKFTYTGTYELIEDSSKNWRIKFLTSGIFTPAKGMSVDVFLVGGGGGGPYSIGSGGRNAGGSSGGGSGYTTTQESVTLEAVGYEIVVGAGGNGGTDGYTNQATDGGSTSAFGFSVDGGKRGSASVSLSSKGVAGGSGSGAGGFANEDNYTYAAGNGGSDGSNGGNNALGNQGGTGQGTTTREFGETTGDLYAGAGAGGGAELNASRYGAGGTGGEGGGGNGGTIVNGTPIAGGAGTTNTGGGGGAGFTSKHNSSRTTAGGAGGSGIVIIRNHREVAV